MNALQALAAVLKKENGLLRDLMALSEEKQRQIHDARRCHALPVKSSSYSHN